MDIQAVKHSYARWSHFYDQTFGAVTNVGRRATVAHINKTPGRVLEVGVGTGLSLASYTPENRVTGIDASPEMLEKAKRRVQEKNLQPVQDLVLMDAREMEFPDDHFDVVTAMHILSVVPEPERVMSEICRVCRPGGQVVITNHFARQTGVLSIIERLSAPFSNLLGWHSDFKIDHVMGQERLALKEQKSLPPAGMMTFLVFEKT